LKIWIGSRRPMGSIIKPKDRSPVNTEKFNRKLTAIFSADVEGYSRLMRDDEDETIHTITTYRSAIAKLVQKYRGRVVDSPGDNILAEFGSVLDAVNCAVEAQRELAERNENLPENRKMRFRIGVNSGDVVEEGERIYGDGVNIAARIEGLADGGGISISGTVYDSIEGKLGLEFEFLGEHSVKNIDKPIRVYRVLSFPGAAAHMVIKAKKKLTKKWIWVAVSTILLLIAVLAGLYWKYFYLPTPENVDPQNNLSFDLPKGSSIAVLPFDNMSSDPDLDSICDGITENIIYALSHVKGLFVIARNSSFSYKGKSIKVQKIGKELGVQYLIEGSIQKSGDLMRITVQLVETKSGNHTWSGIYDRKLGDLFKVQDDIAIQVCEAMQIYITEGETFRNRYDGISDIKIAMKIMKAIELLRHQNDHDAIILGRREAEEVIKLNPNIQIAYGLLGVYNLMAIEQGVCEQPIICFAKATEAARKALSFDEENSDVHILLAYLFLMRGNYENSIKEAKKAILLNSNNADAYSILGLILSLSGQPDNAVLFINKAICIDPIPPTMYLFHLGLAYFDSGQYGKAIDMLEKVLDQKPNHRAALTRLTAAYSLLGNTEKAKQTALELLKVDPDYNLSGFVSKLPYKNKADLDRYIDALRKAGLPE
jgi:adenylate cyclase